jgi:hypothetical protein
MPTVVTPTGSPSLFGGIGRLEFAPNNGPDDPFPTWVDITVFVRTEQTPLSITRGRQSELDTVQSSQLTAILDNTDNRFTFGLTTGPYGAGWAPAKKVRYSETIGQRTYVLYTGWIEAPDVDDWQPIGYQEVSLSCTDRLTRLGRGRPFISTLGEHIRLNGGTSLVGYYPLGDTTGPVLLDAFGRGSLLETYQQSATGGDTKTNPHNEVTYAGGATVTADDLRGILYDPVLNQSGSAKWWRKHVGNLSSSFVVGAGDTVAMACWVNWTRATIDGPSVIQLSGPGPGFDIMQIYINAADGTYRTFVLDDSGGTVSAGLGKSPTIGQWVLLALRLTESSGLVEFWANADPPVTFTISGAPTTATMQTVEVGGFAPASYAHMQVYHGIGAYPRAAHLAQYQMGLTGLEYQTTGQRINTILDYAGVPAGDRAVDPGVSYMQRARLAGQSPETALENAVSTERGRGFAAGDGRYVFHGRDRVLNI